jgi:hypothetical protein
MSFFFIVLFDDLFDHECPISNKEPQNEEVFLGNSIFRVGYSAVQIIFVILTAGKLNKNYSHAWRYSTPVSPLSVGSKLGLLGQISFIRKKGSILPVSAFLIL